MMLFKLHAISIFLPYLLTYIRPIVLFIFCFLNIIMYTRNIAITMKKMTVNKRIRFAKDISYFLM